MYATKIPNVGTLLCHTGTDKAQAVSCSRAMVAVMQCFVGTYNFWNFDYCLYSVVNIIPNPHRLLYYTQLREQTITIELLPETRTCKCRSL